MRSSVGDECRRVATSTEALRGRFVVFTDSGGSELIDACHQPPTKQDVIISEIKKYGVSLTPQASWLSCFESSVIRTLTLPVQLERALVIESILGKQRG